jgi:hypothetical protein
MLPTPFKNAAMFSSILVVCCHVVELIIQRTVVSTIA